ncbi:MAG: ATP-binding cassette domain-containing protein, partial [Phascolarctobacterium sp.]|nr:ATP-binding cassette domain-containing protein [Phascolarctobacterium sp.]
MIKIANLHKSFGNLHVLRGVNLTIAEQEVLVIIGPSGCGKSTLLRCMNFLEEPTVKKKNNGAIELWKRLEFKTICICTSIGKP